MYAIQVIQDGKHPAPLYRYKDAWRDEPMTFSNKEEAERRAALYQECYTWNEYRVVEL